MDDDDDDDKISYDPLYTTAVNIWCSYGQEFGVFFDSQCIPAVISNRSNNKSLIMNRQ